MQTMAPHLGEFNQQQGQIAAIPPEILMMWRTDRRKKRFTACQVCSADLSNLKPYYKRHNICVAHSSIDYTHNGCSRWCQQCAKYEHLSCFVGKKHTCESRLQKHNARRRKTKSEKESNSVDSTQTLTASMNGPSSPTSTWCDNTRVLSQPPVIQLPDMSELSEYTSSPLLDPTPLTNNGTLFPVSSSSIQGSCTPSFFDSEHEDDFINIAKDLGIWDSLDSDLLF